MARKVYLSDDLQMNIELHKDFVIINGVTVPRPARIPPSAWLKWWEDRT